MQSHYKAGQLEAEISKLRKRTGRNDDNQSLYEPIEKLEVALAISEHDNEGECHHVGYRI